MSPEKFESLLFPYLLENRDEFLPIRPLLTDNGILNTPEGEVIRLYVEDLESQKLIKVNIEPFGSIYNWRLQITFDGLKYCLKEGIGKPKLKHEEKIDLVVDYLYERMHINQDYEIEQIMKEIGIYSSQQDAYRVANTLSDIGHNYVESHQVKSGFYMRINEIGVSYWEKNPQDRKQSTPLSSIHHTYNTSIAGPVTNFVQGSSSFTINNQSSDKEVVLALLENLKNKVDEEQLLDELKEDIKVCADEIALKIKADQKVPKFFFEQLTSYGANVSSIGGFLLQIGQIIGYIAK